MSVKTALLTAAAILALSWTATPLPAASAGPAAKSGFGVGPSLVEKAALGTGCRTSIGVFRLNLSGPKKVGGRCCGHPSQTGGRRICGVVVR